MAASGLVRTSVKTSNPCSVGTILFKKYPNPITYSYGSGSFALNVKCIVVP